MICILSQSSSEPTTEHVIDWLRSWNIPNLRINGSDVEGNEGPLFSISNNGANTQLLLNEVSISPSQIKVVWYRRWMDPNKSENVNLFRNKSHNSFSNRQAVTLHLHRELNVHSQFFFWTLDSAKWLGRPSTTRPNKLMVLALAAGAGLLIPDTLVTTSVEDLRQFIGKHGEVIAKPASDGVTCQFGDSHYSTYTSVVTDEAVEKGMWRGEFPSLFQERLKKKYEIRTFYLDGECFSMAMFTQRKQQTQVDFRRYTFDDPTRTVPYKLPTEIEDKIRDLMTQLKLETGSIDMVRTVDGNHVFLEVNPVGQFGMVSYPCNYFLERRVARALADRLYDRKTQEG